jgi:endonuclease/exonuclease/phosphatase (EEP) superfamily protein YafD
MNKFNSLAFVVYFFVISYNFAASAANESHCVNFGHAGSISESPELDSKNIRVLSWNIYKGEKSGLVRDLSKLSGNADLILLQEMVSESNFARQLCNEIPYHRFHMAQAFRRLGGDYTGVATGSQVRAASHRPIISTVTEPILGTSKSALVSQYRLRGSPEPLLVINLHAINFVSQDSFESHLFQLIGVLAQHKGPIIFGGDFNTWSIDRKNFLYRSMRALGLGRVETHHSGFFLLDHIFVRGLKVKKVYDLTNVESSDHKPLLVDLRLL